MTEFEPTVGVSEFAQMIRDAGGSTCNGSLLAMFKAGAFAGYDLYIYQMKKSIEGFIPKREALRWIADHSVEAVIRDDFAEYARKKEVSA